MSIGYIRPNVAGIEEQQILAVSKLALGDPSVIAMWYGESDLVTDADIRQTAINSLNAGETFYGHKRGLPEFQAALAGYVTGLFRQQITPNRITVTQSGMSAIMLIFQTILDPGDNAVIISPVWPNAQSVVRALSGTPRYAVLDNDAQRGWHLDLQKLYDQCDERTRAIFINTPNNPTGWVMPREQMVEVLAFARERGIWIVSDEVYSRMVYDGRAAPSLLEIAQSDDPGLVVNSFSKYFSMTGWRIGWLVVPEALVRPIERLAQNLYISPPAISQVAALGAFDGLDELEAIKAGYARNRAMLLEELPRGGLDAILPADGAFYLYADVSRFTDDSEAFAKTMLREIGVAVTPGIDFDAVQGRRYVRLCYSGAEDAMREAARRINAWLKTR